MNEHPIDSLAQYPWLSFAAAIITLVGLAIAVYRGSRDKPLQTPIIPNEQRWFFDGPIAMAINILRDIKNHLSRLVEIAAPIPEELRKQTELLREIKDEIDKLPSRRARR